jgi:multidrug efflux system membrane fusion protein
MNKKRWMKWGLTGLTVLLLAAGVLRALAARQTQQTALAEQIAHSAQTVVELSAADVIALQAQDMVRGLPVSGTLRAVNSAVIKARVQGELQGLTVREGDAVRAGQVLAHIETAEYEARLRQAQQQADAAKAQIDITQRQHDDNQALVEQGFISKTALNNSRASLSAARASYEAAVAAADVSRKSLNDAVLRAPMSGFVSQRLAQPGERVAVDTKIVEIVDLSRMEIEAALSAADSVSVRVGQKAQLQVEGDANPIPATVARINPSTQAGSRSVLIYLQLKPTAGLRQGLFVQGTVGTEKLKAMALPVTAVRTDKPEPYVQIVDKEQVRHLGVKLGARGQAAGQDMVAVNGLPDGSQVLTGSVGPLREGTLVKLTPTTR